MSAVTVNLQNIVTMATEEGGQAKRADEMQRAHRSERGNAIPGHLSTTSGKAGGLSEMERLKAAQSVRALIAHSPVLGTPNLRCPLLVDQMAAVAKPAVQAVTHAGAPGEPLLITPGPFR